MYLWCIFFENKQIELNWIEHTYERESYGDDVETHKQPPHKYNLSPVYILILDTLTSRVMVHFARGSLGSIRDVRHVLRERVSSRSCQSRWPGNMIVSVIRVRGGVFIHREVNCWILLSDRQ